MTETIREGDRMRITIEGTYYRTEVDALPVGTFGPDRDFDVHSTDDDVVTIEKIEPPVTAFKVGDRVRNRVSGFEYTIGQGGYFCHDYNEWVPVPMQFKSNVYEQVFLHEALF